MTATKRITAGALAWAFCATAALAQATPPRVEEIVQGKCFLCHGPEGESSSPLFPRLAGQHAQYVTRQLADFKSGKRKSDMMKPMVEDLSTQDFKLLGAYYESRATHKHEVDDPALAKTGRAIFERVDPRAGVPSCAQCHGPRGHGTETLPRLAGQHAQYTETQLKMFNKRERTNDNAVMHAAASVLTEQEIKALAAYISGLD